MTTPSYGKFVIIGILAVRTLRQRQKKTEIKTFIVRSLLTTVSLLL